MNSTVNRNIISESTLAPVVERAISTQLNFLIWVEKDVEIYQAMIKCVENSGFHVVRILDSTYIENSIKSIEDPISLAKQSGKKVAVFFNEIHRYAPEYQRFLMKALSDHTIGDTKLEDSDIIFGTATAILNTFGSHVERHSIAMPILNRFCNFEFKA